MRTKILPLGHCSTNPPNERKRCDLPSCTVTGEEAWMIFEGCSHSFHLKCMFCYSWLVCSLGFWLRNASLVKVGNPVSYGIIPFSFFTLLDT